MLATDTVRCGVFDVRAAPTGNSGTGRKLTLTSYCGEDEGMGLSAARGRRKGFVLKFHRQTGNWHFTEILVERRVAALGYLLSTLPRSCSFSIGARRFPSL